MFTKKTSLYFVGKHIEKIHQLAKLSGMQTFRDENAPKDNGYLRSIIGSILTISFIIHSYALF